MSDDEDPSFMTGFLFGNIDEKGRLENDFLDDESKRTLGALSYLGGSDINVKDLLGDEDDSYGEQSSQRDSDNADDNNPTAVDFSDITELIEDEEDVDTGASTSAASYPMGPPPLPNEMMSPSASHLRSPDKSSKQLVTPLADMLPPEFKGKDVREFFPDFRVGEVLRFSRLFPPHYHAPMYKKKKKSEDADKKEASATGPKDIEMNWGPKPTPEQIVKDQHITFLEPLDHKNKSSSIKASTNRDTQNNKDRLSNAWRYGPAQYWYDLYGVDPDATTYDYGMQLKGAEKEGTSGGVTADIPDPDTTLESTGPRHTVKYPDEAYLMVTQKHWEDDIVWSGEDSRAAVQKSQKVRAPIAGWLPTPQCRTVEQYAQVTKTPYVFDHNARQFQSFFPIENDDLVYSAWEKEIIWDPQNMEVIPEPRGLTLDLNDENIVYEIPEDKESEDVVKEPVQQTTTKKEPRKSQLALQKIGIVKEKEEDDEDDKNVNQRKDPFNISNDQYYNSVATDNALKTNVGGNLIQHSTPAVDLKQPFFPTFLGITKLRQFHRYPLKRYSHGAMASSGPKQVLSLQKQIKRKAKLRDQERQAMGGGEIFFMRTPQDLTACDGDLILAEYSEEFPAIMMQPGMATKIKNYYKRKPGGDNKPPAYKYGELAYAHHTPFLGNLNPGQTVQAFENNMYRAPIYPHSMPNTDFLVIRNRNQYYIREVRDIMCVGQICPLMEVPGPNSKRHNNFIRDFLQAFIYRLFWSSGDNPRRIKMEDIKKAFASHSESSIRKRLKLCADFKRTGMDSNWWVVKPDFRLPTQEEIRDMVSAEQCCAFYSLLSAEQRLKDAGYGEKSLFAPEQDEDDEAKIEDEVKTAPWNTTRAYIQAVKGKCLLSLTGDTDPTGCGEGFAYVRVPNKPVIAKGDQKGDTPQKKTVTGTNADLRKLNLADAKKILRDKGFPEAEIRKLSRWEVIDCVRTMSTHEAKAGEEGDMTKFARGNRQSVAEHQERYREECQRLFDLQNKILGSNEILSTDEEGSDSASEDSDYDEMGKNIESMLTNKKSSSQLTKEREEAELKQLHKSFLEPKSKDKLGQSASSAELNSDGKPMVRKLMITRTFRDETEGHLYTRMEVVTKPLVIEAYLKIRKTKSDDFIKQFASLDESQKEEMKRERRRIQEQLRRIKRNEEKLSLAPGTSPSPGAPKMKKPKKENTKDIKLKCGACGQVGHMRTNKECPMWQGKLGGSTSTGALPSVNVALTMEEEENAEIIPADENLIHVEGTKVVLSKQLIEHAEKVKKKTLMLKFPKKMPKKEKESKKGPGKGKRKPGSALHCDYLTKPHKVAHRRRADPLVSLCTVFESIINDMRDIPNSQPFQVPVNSKVVLDYYRIVTKPMDLQTLRANVRERKYENREQFMTDVHQILENSKMYNGPKSVYTLTAQEMFDLTLRRFAEKEDKLMRLEKAINPLLDDNDQVAFSYLLENIVTNYIKTIEQVWPFQQPVNKKVIKDYYDIITEPMDLATLTENIKKHKYHTRDEFLSDVHLIYKNCSRYNGAESPFTATSQRIYDTARQCIEENADQLTEWEEGIKQKQDAAMEGLESESIMTGTSLHDELSNIDPDDTHTTDYTIAEDGGDSMAGPSHADNTLYESESVQEGEEGDYVDIMDEEEVVAGDDITQADQYYTEESYIEQPYATEGYSAEQTYQGESYEGQVYQDQVYGGDQTEVIQQGNLGLDLQLSDGDEDEVGDVGDLTNYRPEAPAAEEDSQMSFNADEFFQTNFQIGGDGGDEPQQHGENGVMMEYETVEGEVMADGDVYVNNTPVPQPGDVVNNDLQLSESDEDLDEQPEGVGFDFDEFDA